MDYHRAIIEQGNGKASIELALPFLRNLRINSPDQPVTANVG
jgi:hypothetical protein